MCRSCSMWGWGRGGHDTCRRTARAALASHAASSTPRRGGPMDGVARCPRPAGPVLPFVDELSDARGGGRVGHTGAALEVDACFMLS